MQGKCQNRKLLNEVRGIMVETKAANQEVKDTKANSFIETKTNKLT